MLELFIELTNQIFWEGYAEQLARETPEGFQTELTEFINSYNSQPHEWYRVFIYQGSYRNHLS